MPFLPARVASSSRGIHVVKCRVEAFSASAVRLHHCDRAVSADPSEIALTSLLAAKGAGMLGVRVIRVAEKTHPRIEHD